MSILFSTIPESPFLALGIFWGILVLLYTVNSFMAKGAKLHQLTQLTMYMLLVLTSFIYDGLLSEFSSFNPKSLSSVLTTAFSSFLLIAIFYIFYLAIRHILKGRNAEIGIWEKYPSIVFFLYIFSFMVGIYNLKYGYILLVFSFVASTIVYLFFYKSTAGKIQSNPGSGL